MNRECCRSMKKSIGNILLNMIGACAGFAFAKND